jgi:hypothetical protein
MARGASLLTDPPGPERDFVDGQAPPSSGGGHRADVLFSRIDDVPLEDEDAFAADEEEFRDGRRRRTLLAAVVIVMVVCGVVVAVGHFGLAWYGGVLEHLVNRFVAERSAPAPLVTQSEPPAAATLATVPAAAPVQKPASGEPNPAPATQASAPDARESPGPTLPPASRPGNRQLAEDAQEAPGRGGDQAAALPAQSSEEPETSEERMAAFLVAELGPAPAAAKALANAAWYDAGRSEHAYWQGVAEAIKRREAH